MCLKMEQKFPSEKGHHSENLIWNIETLSVWKGVSWIESTRTSGINSKVKNAFDCSGENSRPIFYKIYFWITPSEVEGAPLGTIWIGSAGISQTSTTLSKLILAMPRFFRTLDNPIFSRPTGYPLFGFLCWSSYGGTTYHPIQDFVLIPPNAIGALEIFPENLKWNIKWQQCSIFSRNIFSHRFCLC